MNAKAKIPVDWAKQRYAETYVINGRTRLWSGGCGIFECDSLDEARKILHSHAYSHVNAEYHGHQERMASAQRALQKLGDDPFNLGRFRA